MAKITIPEGLTGKELYRFLKTHKAQLIAEKKYETKRGDAVSLAPHLYVDKAGSLVKAAADTTPAEEGDTETQITRACVINTCNWMDSHSDVHIPGLWKRSLSGNKELYLLQEHSMTFKGIITDSLQAYTTALTWKSLGIDFPGTTEALIFNASIQAARNEYMFGQYKAGYVKNHSVGMQYVDLQLAINDAEDEYYKEEFAVWNKYIGQVANASDAEAQGYFWAVREAKVIEGSAVPIGSNRLTPVLETGTGKHSPDGTADRSPKAFDLSAAITKTNFLTP